MIKKIVFTAVILPLVFLLSCNQKKPVILSINPKIGRMGEVITLRGENFGLTQDASYITIAGVAPTYSSYHEWQDDLIMVRVPELGESGLIYVHVNGKKSNGVLFSNSATVPRPIEGEVLGLEPKILSVTPQMGTPGTFITITGSNFGSSRDNGGVFFSRNFEDISGNPFAIQGPEFIEVSEAEFGYDTWNVREIRIRVPDGAASGNLEIRTSRGISRPVPFDVSGIPGVKTYRDKRSYTISYSVNARVTEATRPNTLYLWIPIPVDSPSQQNIGLISRNEEPFVENYRGVNLYKLENLVSGANPVITHSYQVEVYAQETGVRPLSIRHNESSPLMAYTQNSALIPSGNPEIRARAAAITSREQNPYLKARMLYDWVIYELNFVESLTGHSINIVSALEDKQADSCTATLLFAAMARASGIPCIPVAGVLVNRDGQTIRHYWTEIWINDFGWMPVDPVMGARAVPDSFVFKQDWTNYYFGNLDSNRIAFSRGEPVLSQMESRGRLVSRTQSYSLQNIWEEAVGGLESYSSFWGDITITGIYQ
jgi:transglutaminase-like putative cysteine protease